MTDCVRSEHHVASVKGRGYHVATLEDCDHVISALNERIHLATEMGRLLPWIPVWKADIDALLERRQYLAMLPAEA